MTDTEALKALVELARKATPGPWTKVGSAKRTLFTTAQGQQTVAPDKAFPPVEIVTCLRHAEQAQADCDFVQAARNAIPALERMLASQGADKPSVADGFTAIPINPPDHIVSLMRDKFSDMSKIGNNAVWQVQGWGWMNELYKLIVACERAEASHE